MKYPWYVSLATLGPLGYTQGSGTWATLVTLPLAYLVASHVADPLTHGLILMVLMIATLMCVQYAMAFFPGDHDPSAIVLDEIIGCFIVWWNLPLNAFSLIAGVCIFRVLDIFKPFGINRIENLTSPWGIVLDDVVAALLTNVVVRLLIVFIYS